MRFDGWNTLEGRHLVFAYATVILIQGGYFLYVASRWLKLRSKGSKDSEKSTRQV